MRRAAIVVCSLLLTCCTANDAVPRITQLDGSPVPAHMLASHSATVLNFWASWCVYCKEELPMLAEASSRYPEIRFVGINMGEPPRMAEAFWVKMHMSFPTLLDPYGDLKRMFDIYARPTTLFINPEGEIVSRHNGPLSARALEMRLQQLQENVQWQSERATPACPDEESCAVKQMEP